GTADTPDMAVGPTASHPFGTHSGYTTGGVIFPSNHSRADLDAATTTYYDKWKAQYLVAGCGPGQYRGEGSSSGPYTVSEAHGYGMLITVIMAGHDPKARDIFDGMYAYYAAHGSTNNKTLMAWAQDEQCANTGGADSATDADLDIAYALLLADRQW